MSHYLFSNFCLKFDSCEVRKDIETNFWKISGQVSRAQQALKIAQNEVSGKKMFLEISLTFPGNESVNGLLIFCGNCMPGKNVVL